MHSLWRVAQQRGHTSHIHYGPGDVALGVCLVFWWCLDIPARRGQYCMHGIVPENGVVCKRLLLPEFYAWTARGQSRLDINLRTIFTDNLVWGGGVYVDAAAI